MRTITDKKYTQPVFLPEKGLWVFMRLGHLTPEYAQEIKFIHTKKGCRMFCTSDGEMHEDKLSTSSPVV